MFCIHHHSGHSAPRMDRLNFSFYAHLEIEEKEREENDQEKQNCKMLFSHVMKIIFLQKKNVILHYVKKQDQTKTALQKS